MTAMTDTLDDAARERTFGGWVRRALAALGRELPWAYARMCEALGERVVAIEVEGERAVVRCTGCDTRVSETLAVSPTVELETTRRAVVGMADGEETLVEAVLSGSVVLRGAPDDLAAFHDALVAFLQGAVRAPSFPWKMEEFRKWQTARDGRG